MCIFHLVVWMFVVLCCDDDDYRLHVLYIYRMSMGEGATLVCSSAFSVGGFPLDLRLRAATAVSAGGRGALKNAPTRVTNTIVSNYTSRCANPRRLSSFLVGAPRIFGECRTSYQSRSQIKALHLRCFDERATAGPWTLRVSQIPGITCLPFSMTN